jgi:hypothetical protein
MRIMTEANQREAPRILDETAASQSGAMRSPSPGELRHDELYLDVVTAREFDAIGEGPPTDPSASSA